MKNDINRELPIRAKLEMAKDVVTIIHCLHTGKREMANSLIEDLKARSVQLDEKIQQDVLIFAEQIHFQYAYDPWHQITKDVQRAADRLMDDLELDFFRNTKRPPKGGR